MSLTTKQEHVTTTCALYMISKWHKQHWFRSASPRPRAFCLCLCLASPRLRTLLPCLASASTSLPRPLPLPRQNCLEPIPVHIWRDSLHRLRSYCWETARRSIRPNFSVHPVGKTMCWIQKWMAPFWWSRRALSTCKVWGRSYNARRL